MRKIFLSGIFVCLSFITITAQIQSGSWRDHLAFSHPVSLAITPKKVFTIYNQSGILSFNKETGEIERLSKIQDFSDIDPTSITYNEVAEVVVVGYRSGYIDLITHDGILNLSDIERKNLVVSKTINNIECWDNLAYLACDFGIVVVDLSKKEIKDSYFFGPEGTSIQVNNLTLTENDIYAATKSGLYKASLNSTNLLDYNNWQIISNVPEPDVKFKLVEAFSNRIFAVYNSNNGDGDKIIYLEDNNWNEYTRHPDTLIYNIDAYQNRLSITGKTSSLILSTDFQIEREIDVINVKHLLTDESGRIYIASSNTGFSYMDGTEVKYLGVNGPRFNTTGKISVMENQIWVGSGGPFRPFKEGGGHNFTDEKWTSLNAGWNKGLEDVGNLYKFVFNPNNPNHVYASAYLYGLYEIEDLEVTGAYKYDNTPIFQSTIASNVGVRIMGLDFDSKGNLWTIFDETDQPVYKLTSDNEWINCELKSGIFGSTNNFSDLLVTKDDQIWILSRKAGIIVLKEENDGSITENHFTIKNIDDENLSSAYCLVEDTEGDIWVGTNKGPIVYNPTPDVLSNNDVRGYQIKIPRNDGTGLADYLLDYEIINSIAVDGGNRKWLATENSGVFLVSDDGKKTIHHFHEKNSPLPSNNIIGAGVQEKTGEVLFSTNRGIVSFMGSATVGNNDFSNVHVYPNPIRPEYEGEITVTGLVSNTIVKITDISGNLVYENYSLGGQAVWDGKDFDGNRVHTGVYLVFLSNEDGSKTHITKLLFIH